MDKIFTSKKAALGIGFGFLLTIGIVAAGSVAWASHQFADVPDSHTHHAGISYVKDVGITAGCGDGTNYCPEDFVKRSQMATFLHRASGSAPGIAPSVNAKALSGHEWSEIDNRFAALENKLAAVTYDAGMKVLRITGANLQIVSGSGNTNGIVNGLGNLVIGYNEAHVGEARGGSHNLVVGAYHSYSNYGGLVAGIDNKISGSYSSVSGGSINTASGIASSVSGGSRHFATGHWSSVTGGYLNSANGSYSSVSGGNSRAVGADSEWRAGDLYNDPNG